MKIGFIGTGNMGTAIIEGLLGKDMAAADMMVCDISQERVEALNKKYGVAFTTDSKELVKSCRIVVLALKPQVYDNVMNTIKPEVTEDKIIVTMAPGISHEHISGILGERIKVTRTMPNTPAMVNEGMTALCPNKNMTDEETKEIVSIFNCIGKTELLPEKLFDCFTGLSGSSPAYVYMFIESMADAAVLCGMPRDTAYRIASQAVLGSAKTVMETGLHPGHLKDMVCSPGGTTIEAVAALEQAGFRNAVMNAVVSATVKASQMANQPV